MNNPNDRQLWVLLFRRNHQLNDIRFKQVEDRLQTVEDAVVTHSRRSNSNSQQQYFLLGVILACFFLLGLTIEGNVGTSKISYSANKLTQIILQIFSAGGVAVAIANHPKIKQIFKK